MWLAIVSSALLLFSVSAIADSSFFQPRRLSNSHRTLWIGRCKFGAVEVAPED